MARFVRISLVVLVVLSALAVGAYEYLLAPTSFPAKSDYVLDFTEIRRLAASLPGHGPLRVNQEQIAEGGLPRGAVFAGESLRETLPFWHGAYQVVFADAQLVIDSGFDEETQRRMNGDLPFSRDGYATIQRALGAARWIVITHEHEDHIGGIARLPRPERLVGRLVLTREQLEDTAWLTRAHFPESLRTALTPLAYEKYHALAPGVVLVKAPGHTPGTQLIYVRLASGRELLFVGDVAWHMDQIRKLAYRPRLVTDFYVGENRAAVMAELRALHDLEGREPVQLVVSHDIEQHRQLIAAGVIGEHFEP